jgi:hypothetical protein
VISRVASQPLLIAALRNPACLAQIDTAGWELLVRQARRADLLPALALRLARSAAVTVPPQAQAHLDAATVLASAQRAEVLRELGHIRAALATVGVQPVLLKGAAYVAAGLPPSEGRLFNDIDLMLPKPLLPQAEAQLMLHGWATTHHSAYDQRYYREWMHELPPMRHIQRQSVLDLHHAILPETARLRHDPAKLLAAAVPAPLCPGFRVLAPADMVLHSVSHLAHNDDMTHLLRDLTDIDLLLRNFCDRADFWSELLTRAQDLNLARPLHYILRESHDLLCTPIPAGVLQRATREGAPSPLLGYFMRGLWRRAMYAAHPSMATKTAPLALGMLYVRAHWLRMPPGLLARHLAVKALGLNRTMKK